MTEDTLLSLFTSAKNLQAFGQPTETLFQTALSLYHEHAPLPLTRQSFHRLNALLHEKIKPKTIPQKSLPNKLSDDDIAQALHENILKKKDPAATLQPLQPSQPKIVQARGGPLDISETNEILLVPSSSAQTIQVSYANVSFESEYNLLYPTLTLQSNELSETISLESGHYTIDTLVEALKAVLPSTFSCQISPLTRKLTLIAPTPFSVQGLFAWDHDRPAEKHVTSQPVLLEACHHVNGTFKFSDNLKYLVTLTKNQTWFHEKMTIPPGTTKITLSFDRPVYRYLLCLSIS